MHNLPISKRHSNKSSLCSHPLYLDQIAEKTSWNWYVLGISLKTVEFAEAYAVEQNLQQNNLLLSKWQTEK